MKKTLFLLLLCALFSCTKDDDLPGEIIESGSQKISYVEFVVGTTPFKMMKVEGSKFNMGSDDMSNTRPVHSETVGTFYIGETEVTQELWVEVMEINPSNHKGDNLPVEKVSWEDCQKFVQRLNRLTGQHFRLPTEAEWEFAARGGKNARGCKYSGSDIIEEVALFSQNSWGQTHKVASLYANELGIYDMSGNVLEWTSDLWSSNYGSDRDGGSSGKLRVVRGGNYNSNPSSCEVVVRDKYNESVQSQSLGLRLALDFDENAKPEEPEQTNVVRFDLNGTPLLMVEVIGGTYTMGADNMASNARPAHPETLATFHLGMTEVTQAQWVAVMGSNPSYHKGDDLPVENVSWEDCQEFIKKVNQITGYKFRLPTEAEWEYAALGGIHSWEFSYSGSEVVDDVAWYSDNSYGQSHQVATKRFNELGLYDMSGNVDEWTSDLWSSNYGTDRDGGSSGKSRVVRGGNFNNTIGSLSVKTRSYDNSSYKRKTLGLRLAVYYDENDVVPEGVDRYMVNGVKFDMIKIDAGNFQMGSTNGAANERPVKTQYVNSFSIGKTEVTQALWTAIMGNNPSNFQGDNLPVEYVSWNDCQEFIKRLNNLTGYNFRLPTEKEWEYAARGGSKSRGYTYSGSNVLDNVGWYDSNSEYTTHPVGEKAENELGLCDMSGNVFEWTSDLWSEDYSSERDGGTGGDLRVIRGGGYRNTSNACRNTFRHKESASSSYTNLGFRLVLSDDVPNTGRDFVLSKVLGELELNTEVTVAGYVAAVSSQGPVVTDASGSVFVYSPTNNSDLKIGDQVIFTGRVTHYNYAFQIKKGATLEVVGSQKINYPTPRKWTVSEIDAMVAASTASGAPLLTPVYSQFTGTVTVSGNYINMNIDGTTVQVSPYGLSNNYKALFTNGATVTVKGYLMALASKGKYLNTIITKVGTSDISTLAVSH